MTGRVDDPEATAAYDGGVDVEEGAGRGEVDAGSGGRERQSATTLVTPGTCRMSVVNSAINDRCLVWRGERSVALPMAPQSGLWSV